ncbi:hypothetical protein F4810DRAFT_656636, partial [Camillea tinctor]
MEDHLGTLSSGPTDPDNPCFQSRIQHAFRLLAYEQSEYSYGQLHSWSLRNKTVYHSFDTVIGKSVWLVVESSMDTRETIANSLLYDWGRIRSPSDSFSGTLEMHLRLVKWIGKHLSQYVDHLSKRSRRLNRIMYDTVGRSYTDRAS